MAALTLDEIGYEDVLKNKFGYYIKKGVLRRVAFELASRLETLSSDDEREVLMNELEVRVFTVKGRERNLGLHVKFEKMNGLYVPARWSREYREREAHGDSPGCGYFMEGVLSSDDGNGLPIDIAKTEEERRRLHIFDNTIVSLPPKQQISFFAYYSEWRERVIEYTRWRLGDLAERMDRNKESLIVDEQTKTYFELIRPLVERYRQEVLKKQSE